MEKHIGLFSLPAKIQSLIIFIFLFLLGSHLLDYHLLYFIFTAVILIDWKNIYLKEVWILSFFLLSVYITYFFLNSDIMYNLDKLTRVVSQAIMLFFAYLLGLSIRNVSFGKTFTNHRVVFYLFFGFFIAYMVSLLYSYVVLPEDNPITREGMYVSFQNEYKRLNVNGGNLVSTVIAYYLTFAAITLPFILFFFKEFRAKKFTYFELLFLLGTALFALFLASEMHRRTVIFLLLLTFVFLGVSVIVNKLKARNYYHILVVVIVMIFLMALAYYLFEDTKAVKRLMSLDITQVRRFQFWLPGLEIMMDYPFGGGHSILVGHNMKLAHNTWIDIGKDFGVIPFIASIIFFVVHIPYLLYVFLSKKDKGFISYIFVVMFICIIAIMMIEPVFTSDKTFFFYIIFYFGFLKNYADCIRSSENKNIDSAS